MATPKNRGESRGSERERGFSNIQQPEDSEIRRPTLLSMASAENPAGLLHCFPHLHPASILQILAKSIPQGTRHERIVGFKTSKTSLVQGHLGGSVMKVQLLISARVTISVLWEPAWGSLLPSPFAPSPLCVLSPFLKKKKKTTLKYILFKVVSVYLEGQGPRKQVTCARSSLQRDSMTKLAKRTQADKPHLVPVTNCLLIGREASWVLAHRVKRDLAGALLFFSFSPEMQRDRGKESGLLLEEPPCCLKGAEHLWY